MRKLLIFTFQIMLFYQAAGQNINSFIAAFSQDSLIKTVRELSDIYRRLIPILKTKVSYQLFKNLYLPASIGIENSKIYEGNGRTSRIIKQFHWF